MPPLYVTQQGASIGVESRRLVIRKEGETLSQVPLIKIDAVYLMGMIQITTQAMRRLMKAGIDLVFLTQAGDYRGRLVGTASGFGELRRWQYRRADEADFSLRTAQAMVEGKLRNQRSLLARVGRDRPDDQVTVAAGRLDDFIRRAGQAAPLGSLLGVEGSGTAAYFGVFGRLFSRPWPFEKRVRRPPTDPVNVLLSLGYTLLARAAEQAIYTVGLDPYIGFLHAQARGRPSLALDMMEEFRPLVVDRAVLSVCNNRRVTPANFTPGRDPQRPIVLDEAGRNAFLRELEARWTTRLAYPATREQASYRRCLELQVRHLARCLQTGGAYRPLTPRS
jgi:CRISPR-associated protein Cas1